MSKTPNLTGIEPTEFNVLVQLDAVNEFAGSLKLPDEIIDRKRGLQTRGTLIAVSPLAFSYDDWSGIPDQHKPKVGDKVIIAKGAGVYIDDLGEKGTFHRLIKDKDVCAIVREPVKAAKAA